MALLTSIELKQTLGVGDLYPDEYVDQVTAAAIAVVSSYITAEAVEDEPAPVREATLALAVDIWQSRVSPGGQMVGADFTPAPFRLGRNFLQKVSGLLAPYMDENGMIG